MGGMGPRCAYWSFGMLLLVALARADAAGRGLTQTTDIMKPGYGMQGGEVRPCPVGSYNPGSSRTCILCGGGWTTDGPGKTSFDNCFIIPGWEWDAVHSTPRPCDKGSWSSGGTAQARLPKCQACPAGFTTQEQESDRPEDCEICAAGHGGLECTLCPANTFSAGGIKNEVECTPCEDGLVSSKGSINVDQCFNPVLEPNFDNFFLNDNRRWKKPVGKAGNALECAALCTAASKPFCLMSRWSDDGNKCQLLFEVDVSKNTGFMGFRVAGGQDYVLWTVPSTLTAGTRLAALKNKTLKDCLDACTKDNNCELVTHPGFGLIGGCKLFKSELDADWVTRVHVDGSHLYSNQMTVGPKQL